ncbi:MAG: gamma carbonic anhydrase family protein [Candidatus Micrarchaeia archaeon]
MGFTSKNCEVGKETKLGKNVYIASFAVLRSDEGKIIVGNNCSIQECVVVHGSNVVIGNNVTIGHGAVVHGCKVGNNVLIGINSTLLSGCEIGDNCIVAAGALVPEGKKIPSGSVLMGMPAKIVRECTKEDLSRIKFSYESYLKKLKEMKKFEK